MNDYAYETSADGEPELPSNYFKSMESVHVEIFGQSYSIKGAADHEYIRELASFVDAKMKDVQKGTGTADPQRVAILAALNISDELHRLRGQHRAMEETTLNAARRLLSLTDEPPDKGV